MAEHDEGLTPARRQALVRAARSRTAPHGVVQRARVVLDCADVGIAEAARRSEISPSTAAKWWHRFLRDGFDGLRDLPRSGRPAATADDVERVLRYALADPPSGARRWSTRMIAQDSGLSQATVSRIRRKHFPAFDPATRLLPDTSTAVLVYVDVQQSGCALGFHRTSGVPIGGTPSPAMIDAVETVGSTALLRRPHTGYRVDDDGPRALRVLHRAAERLPSAPRVTLLIDVPLDDAARRWLAQHPGFIVHSVTPGDWHAAAHRLNDILDARQLAEVQGIQQRVRRTDGNGFTWVRPARAASVTAAAGLPAAWTAAVPDSAGGDLALIIEGICGGLDDGSLTGGDLLSSRSLARRTGMTPGRAAECLTQLAAEAIIDQRGSDYLLPAPVALDVVETYTARGLLGTAIVRRLAATGATVPAVVDGLLDRIEVCHDLGLTHEAYKLDLEVQDELARTAAMPRIGWMFVQLTLQLRLFTKVLGLQYQYPVAEIITDDRRIVDEIRCKDPAAAVDAWRSKVDNCADYMLRTIEASPYRR